jgi:endoglucanase
MAYMVSTATQSPPYVTIPAGRPDLPPILNGLAVWKIILIVVGSVFVAIALGAVVCYRKREQIRAWAAARKLRTAEKNMPKYVVKRSVPPPPPPPPRNYHTADRDVEALEVGQGQPTLLQDVHRSS